MPAPASHPDRPPPSPRPPRVYRLAAALFERSPLPPRLARSRRGRSGAVDGWLDWARTARGDRPLAWCHAASVGEALSLLPTVRRLRAAPPWPTVVLTHSSPSVADWPPIPEFDRRDFVPPERPRAVAAVLGALRPQVLLFARGDLWPELVSQAHRAGVPVAVCGGVVRPASRRLRAPARGWFRPMHAPVAWIGAVDREHAARWGRLGCDPATIEVTGDPRDQAALERAVSLTGLDPLLDGRPAVVAGSVHRADEGPVLEAFATVHRRIPETRLVIAPHRPTPRAAARILALARGRGFEGACWPGADPAAPVAVVTTVGWLADLYAAAAAAYVGGGFGSAGVHSVIEPLALAVPVAAGPAAATDAGCARFVDGGVRVVRSAESLAGAWLEWLEHPEERWAFGLRGRGRLDAGAGTAAARAVRRIAGWGGG